MRLASLHLKRAERDLIMKADWVFDISADDMTFWKVRASAHRISWLPPLLDAAPSGRPPPLPWHDRPYDAVYLGNLNTPNNVEGLTWFVKTVLPELRIRRSEISILIAGSNPSQEVLDLVESDSSLQVRVNPADVGEVRALGRVMINPVLQGSGVNVKSVEMLATDSPVVTTPVGVQGLDAETIGAFHIADTPQEFAAMVDQLIDLGPVNDNDRNDIRSRFGKGGAQALSQKLTEIIAQNRS